MSERLELLPKLAVTHRPCPRAAERTPTTLECHVRVASLGPVSQILACCVWACKKTYGGAAKVKHQRLRNRKGTTELARVCVPASSSASSSTRVAGQAALGEVAPELATGDDSSLAI